MITKNSPSDLGGGKVGKAIFKNGKIFEGVQEVQTGIGTVDSFDAEFEVIPPHNFKEGQEVFEDIDYKLEYYKDPCIDENGNLLCDIKGCNSISVNGGGHYRELGYICLCSKHSNEARNGATNPKIKKHRLEKEKTRGADGVLPHIPPTAVPLPPVAAKEEKAKRNNDTLYTYYQLELKNINEEWDITVCESLEDVYGMLQYLDIHLDDDTETADGEPRQVIITGVAMTPIAYKRIKEESQNSNH